MTRSFWLSCLAILMLFTLPVRAEQCPEGNLLAGKLPISDVGGGVQLGLATDSEIITEGGLWNAAQALVFADVGAFLVYDLGAAYPLQSMLLQADSNDFYRVSGSLDNQTFSALWSVPQGVGHGQRVRMVGNLAGVSARFLKLEPVSGDGSYAFTELQVSCEQPFLARLKVVQAQAQGVVQEQAADWRWDDASASRWQLVLALLALILYGVHRRTRAGKWSRRCTDGGLAVLALVSGLTYFNFGAFHFPNYIHTWDSYHYYMGSKYFPELGYDGLYDCSAIADVEAGLGDRVAARKQTNLQTNRLEATDALLADPQRCLQRFSAQRWSAFKADVAVFRDRTEPQRWDIMTTDHGFNATPVWTMLGAALAGLAPLTEQRLLWLTALDPLFLLAAFGLIGWAFGWRTMALGMAIFACYFPARFYWTGGSFLRWDWLFWSVAAVCLLRKRYPLLGGLSLGYAALLRVFPGVMAVGLLLVLLYRRWKHRRWDLPSLRFFAGMLIVGALLVPASELAAQRPGTHLAFIGNTLKHAGTPLTNNMGLRTVLAYRSDETGQVLFDEARQEPWRAWQEARLAAFGTLKPLYAVLALGWLALLIWALRSQPQWVALALGATLIPVAVDLTSYYYAFILVLAPLCVVSPRAGYALLGLSAASQFIAWAPLAGMSSWFDVQFALISLLTLVGFLLVIVMVGRTPVGPGDRLHAGSD
ncbi:MAG: hypothetical protein ABWY06_17105 [Pseudomonas sp.]|uniref:hypothetical protein n=1 Tax=Pseudomonas sp. TaxID=306 RepID=UPI0033923195